ncbi:MAG: hypothetical protein PHO02_03815 [Candidatus Nanoarchaeia archaeon]|nr:hypothetical protein [Candidatus Nanoarchaeia archaeon]
MTSLKGISEYGVAKAAYEAARAILSAENPDRKELSDLLGVLDANKEGAELLKNEIGEEYDSVRRKAALVFPKCYLHLRIRMYETMMEDGWPAETAEELRTIIIPSLRYAITGNSVKTGENIAVCRFNSLESLLNLIKKFSDFNKVDELKGRWLRIDPKNKILSIDEMLSRRIIEYAEFRKGIIEGSYEGNMKVQKEIETILGMNNTPVLSPDISQF